MVVTRDGAIPVGSVRFLEQPGVAMATIINAAAVMCRRFIQRFLGGGISVSTAL
jgi:hypothetical protein